MLRLVAGFLLVLAFAAAAAWLADQPGEVTFRWSGYQVTTSILVAAATIAILVLLGTLLWRSYYWLTGAPGALGDWFRNRGRRKGYDALSHGLIAAGAGDAEAAAHEVAAAERHLGGAPLTLLLKAQTAQLRGDTEIARRAYEAMIAQPETEALGLRGLYLEARRRGDRSEAKAFVTRAVALKPGMAWASEALFELQAAEGDWADAIETLDLRRRHKHIDKKEEARARAVVLTARAQEAADANLEDEALEAATSAHKLALELIPAAAIAGRILAERGDTSRAARMVDKTWRLSPHPDLATIFTHARPGDATQDRLRRARQLAGKLPGHPESAIALARAAMEARDWKAAREALASQVEGTPTRRVCMLMAEIENGEHGNRGRVREWLARAVTASRDPAWTADGHVSERWLPVSPVTGAFDVYEWRVPVEGALPGAGQSIEELGLADVAEARALIVSADRDGEPALDESDGDAGDAADSKDNKPPAAKAPEISEPEADAEPPITPKKKPSPASPPKDAEKADRNDVFVAPVPDDPGVDGDDFDGSSKGPKDIESR